MISDNYIIWTHNGRPMRKFKGSFKFCATMMGMSFTDEGFAKVCEVEFGKHQMI